MSDMKVSQDPNQSITLSKILLETSMQQLDSKDDRQVMSERHIEQLNDTEENNIRTLHQSEVQM